MSLNLAGAKTWKKYVQSDFKLIMDYTDKHKKLNLMHNLTNLEQEVTVMPSN
jgi:hypothetical protein